MSMKKVGVTHRSPESRMQNGSAWALLPPQADIYASLHQEQTTGRESDTSQQGMSGRHCLVDGVFGEMEWGVISASSSVITHSGSYIRCIRIVGVWCMAWQKLVSGGMGCPGKRSVNCGDGAGANRVGLLNMGPILAGMPGVLQV